MGSLSDPYLLGDGVEHRLERLGVELDRHVRSSSLVARMLEDRPEVIEKFVMKPTNRVSGRDRVSVICVSVRA